MSDPNAATRLVLALHNHQPVGNFDDVFAYNLDHAYRPFLAALKDFPDLRVVLHLSGSLLEWLLAKAPDYVADVRGLIERGQAELLGGPRFEPVLAAIPRRDRVGQIIAYADQLHDVFGVRPRGIWVPERVWEPSFAGDVTAAGVEYTLLDDSQFHAAGCRPETMPDSVLCEDEGRLLRVFPISEPLRYQIPFSTVDEAISGLRKLHEADPGRTRVFGDDGEKFGGWPETFTHVYEDRWLCTFFERLSEEQAWLRTATLAEVVNTRPADGRLALPDGSYGEMTEWVLPPQPQRTLQQLRGREEADTAAPAEVRPFLRGGTWRNFLSKYPEAGDMAARMKELSARVESLRRTGADAEVLEAATTHLYRGQCNCPYWHGSFGGLYLPHLRQAIYRELLAVERLIRPLERGDGPNSTLVSHDLNLDGRPEVRLGNDRILATVEPHAGGQVAALDVLSIGVNLGATLDRREEPYHLKLRGRPADAALAEHLQTDRYRRRSLVDHLLTSPPDFDAFVGGLAADPAVSGPYAAVCRRNGADVEVSMTATRTAAEREVRVEKALRFEADRPSELIISYELSDVPSGVPLWLAVEFNFAGMAPAAEDRYFYSAAGDKLGPLDRQLDLTSISRLGLCDEYLGLDVTLETSEECELWAAPLRSVSGSEGGVELVYQQTTVVPRWEVRPDAEGRWAVEMRLSFDTTAAAARDLAAAGSAMSQ